MLMNPLLRTILLALGMWCSLITSASAENYSDIWWNPAESGWGVTIADHETNIFAVLFAYRNDRRPIWFVIPGGTFSQGRRIFQGDVYVTSGPPYTNPTFDSTSVVATRVGMATIDFSPPGLAPGTLLLTYTISGTTVTKQIQRQPFGTAAPNWGTDKTDIWWNPNESGWGLALTQHGNNIFGVWYTYDTDHVPLWLVLPGGVFTSTNSFTGTLYRTTGSFFGDRFDSASVVVTAAGSATITFGGASATTSLASKALTECPGLSANFVATIGSSAYPRLTCPQPFGLLRPSHSSSGALTFTIKNPLMSGISGQPYSDTVVASVDGGAAPYHFRSDTFINGTLPPGLVITLDGHLQGTPSTAITSSHTYTFGVCVDDIAGASLCEQTSITINASSTSLTCSAATCSPTPDQSSCRCFNRDLLNITDNSCGQVIGLGGACSLPLTRACAAGLACVTTDLSNAGTCVPPPANCPWN